MKFLIKYNFLFCNYECPDECENISRSSEIKEIAIQQSDKEKEKSFKEVLTSWTTGFSF